MSKVPDTKENASKCICPNCPTWNSSSCPGEKSEKFFCSRGKTECALERRGCICGECPIFLEYDLKNGYFCVEGEA